MWKNKNLLSHQKYFVKYIHIIIQFFSKIDFTEYLLKTRERRKFFKFSYCVRPTPFFSVPEQMSAFHSVTSQVSIVSQWWSIGRDDQDVIQFGKELDSKALLKLGRRKTNHCYVQCSKSSRFYSCHCQNSNSPKLLVFQWCPFQRMNQFEPIFQKYHLYILKIRRSNMIWKRYWLHLGHCE